MHLLLLTLTTVAFSSACAPSTSTSEPATGRKKRSIEPVIVTLVTNAAYDEATNQQNLVKVKTTLRNFVKAQNLQLKTQYIEVVKNSGGKFAIEYAGNFDCIQVKNFVLGVKAQSQELAYVLLNCASEPLQIF